MTPSDLTDEQINVAVALKLGWKKGTDAYPSMWCHPSGTPIGFIPKFSASLDACAEARKVLTVEQTHSYAFHLMESMQVPHALRNTWRCYYNFANATAREHCLAFLAATEK